MTKFSSFKYVRLVIFISIILSLFLYRNSLSAFFFQDDWFSLRISKVRSLTDFLSFFIPRKDVIFYKPFGMQIPYFILSGIFGVNALPFHFLAFATHIANIIGAFLLIRQISKREDIAAFVSFLYATSTIHFTQFYWPAAYSFMLGPTMFIYSFLFFLLFISEKNIKYFLFSFTIYFIGLFTNEMVYISSLIFILYILIFSNIRFIRYLIPYIISGIAIIFSRFIYFPPPVSGSYQIAIGKYVLNNYEGFLLWCFNLPEEIKAQLITFWKINPEFIKNFPTISITIFISLAISILLFIAIPLMRLKIKDHNMAIKYAIFGLIWFMCGLFPVIFFPKHSFSYFLSIPALGLFFTFSMLTQTYIQSLQKQHKNIALIYLAIISLNWVYMAYSTIQFNTLVHWAPRRAEIAKKLTSEAKKFYREVPKDKTIMVYDSSENKLALNNQDAFKIIYNNESVKTVYASTTASSKYLIK